MRRCFHQHSLRLLFFFISEIFRCVGGSSGQEVICAVGESVTFNTSVPDTGTIRYKDKTVGHVFKSDTSFSEKFVNRLHWDKRSGFFILSDLRTADSGLYTVESTKDTERKQDYQLEVYERVSVPQVKTITSSSSEFCSVQCSVRNSRGLILSLYEDEYLLNRTSSNITTDITLNLHLEIKKTDNHRLKTFSCLSSNPVSNERTEIELTHYCALNTAVFPDVESPVRSRVLIALVCAVISLMSVVVIVVGLRNCGEHESCWCSGDRKIHEILSVTTEVVYEQTMSSSDLSDHSLLFSDIYNSSEREDQVNSRT